MSVSALGAPRNSTLVETVSLDFEDFNESFLTCSTCLCTYDGGEHTPKLLPCSHTVCLQCLGRIVATFARDTGQIRCPICRELTTVPAEGVRAMPPSFLVNQLLDLMARQRRDVVPKCSAHSNQELLFCETCDSAFCVVCTGGAHRPGGDIVSSAAKAGSVAGADHTVIPFAVAIRRMSEILAYKAKECKSKLDDAMSVMTGEVHRLDHNADSAFERVNAAFQMVLEAVEDKRKLVLAEIADRRHEKRTGLQQQIEIIQAEAQKVEADVKSMQHKIEVRQITKKISDLNCKLDSASTLLEPRENAYLEFVTSPKHEDLLLRITAALDELGQIRTSRTFPSLCRVALPQTVITNLRAEARIMAIDCDGGIQNHGGDPVAATVTRDATCEVVPSEIVDRADGTYDVVFTAHASGAHTLRVLIFNRVIKDTPLHFDVTEHNPPLAAFGERGSKDKCLTQPCNVAVSRTGRDVFVVDTGNSRIKRLNSNLDFCGHISSECLEGRSVTGICMGPEDDSLFVANWRTRTVSEIALDGCARSSFTHEQLVEPVDVALDPIRRRVLVADHGASAVHVFDLAGSLLLTIDKLKDISSVCVTDRGDYVVAGSCLQLYDADGAFLRSVAADPKGRYGGVACDSRGLLLATRVEKTRSYLQVFSLAEGSLRSVVDSHGSRQKRPTGLAIMEEGEDGGERYVVVVDIGSDCVRKYRYY